VSAPTVERSRRNGSRGNGSRAGTPGDSASRTGTSRGSASATAASRKSARAEARTPGARRTDSGAVGRAYARKAGRSRPVTDPDRGGAIGRSRFVLLVMGLLGSGLVASLWLSTSAAADSYRLDAATRATRDLSERSETLRTEIAAMRSAPALARAARDLGMVPTTDVARLVSEPGGGVIVVGTPKAAYAPAPAVAPAPVGAGQPGAVPNAPAQPGTAVDAAPNPGQPGFVPTGAGQPGAGAVTNQQGVVPSRPVGAPAAQAAPSPQTTQTQQTAQAQAAQNQQAQAQQADQIQQAQRRAGARQAQRAPAPASPRAAGGSRP